MKNNRLKGKIIEKFGSANAFAQEIGIHPSTLSHLINEKTSWRSDMIAVAAERLGITCEEIGLYFLPERLAGREGSDEK